MALKKTTTTPHGFESVDAYITCEGIRLIGKDQIKFQVRTRKEPGLPFFDDTEHTAPYSMDSENPFKQAYDHIKSLPEFLDAQDC
jgi:hypothetical protein